MVMSPALVYLATLLVGTVAPDEAAELRAELRGIREREAAALATLANTLERDGDKAKSAEVRTLAPKADEPDRPWQYVPLPELVPGPDKGLASRPTAPRHPEAVKARDQAADDLLKLAARSAKAGRLAIADECLRGVLERKPDQSEARRLLGYVPHQGGWATPFAVDMLKRKKVDHPIYGWIDADWVPQLDQGLLPGKVINGRPEQWLAAAQADAMRADIQHGWEIRTAHFFVRTDVPLARAIAFGRRLENLHAAFHSIMADVLGADSALARRYQNKAPATIKPHEVWYFADKTEYVNYLKRIHGLGVDLELGRYDPARRRGDVGRSYFYRDDNGQVPVEATLYHEASHQLLFESGPRSGYESNVGQYWVFEGLGTYFETLEPQPDGSLELGGFVGPRLALARERIIDKGELVPLDKLVAMNKARFDGSGGGDVYLNYAQAMALTDFLMQAGQERYRDAFLDYVADAYRGNFRRGGTARPLFERFGTTPEALQEQFLEFLKSRPQAAG
jgi:hypothetical protein